MIHDRLDRLPLYLPDTLPGFDAILRFVAHARPDMPEGRTELSEPDVFARIMSYPTKLPGDCAIEAHDECIDIQFTLRGAEGISIYPRESLELEKADAEKDFYVYRGEESPLLRVKNRPGYFSLIFPHEAHRPQESTDGKCAVVKKGVVKIKMSCWTECGSGTGGRG